MDWKIKGGLQVIIERLGLPYVAYNQGSIVHLETSGVMLLDFASFRPLSIIILRMVNNVQAIADAMKQPGFAPNLASLPTLSIRMATATVTIGPIILVYPFVQRYFVKGLTLGAIKG